ncbi:MAG: hypothetical protein ABIO60_09860, partial [Aquaticitalea sp.]
MKKITSLLLLLCVSLSFGQVVLDENFEAGLTLPTGWTNNEITATGNIWTFETGGNAPYFGAGNTAFYTLGGFDGNYAVLDSDFYGGGPEETALESPVFDCSAFTTVKVTYDHFFVGGYGGAAYVEVYDGTAWVEVASYTSANVADDTGEYGHVILDVS